MKQQKLWEKKEENIQKKNIKKMIYAQKPQQQQQN